MKKIIKKVSKSIKLPNLTTSPFSENLLKRNEELIERLEKYSSQK